MLIRRLGGDSRPGQSPTLYATDRESYLVQGWRTDTDHIEIPHGLLRWLEPGTCLGSILTDSGHGTFTIGGWPIADQDILAEMKIPAHESAVEVPMGVQRRRDAEPGV